MDKAITAPTMKLTCQKIGEDNLLKMLIVSIKMFHDMVRGGEKTNPVEIIGIANRIMDTYPHESFKDVLMAFNKAVVSGKKFYGGISTPEIFEIINEHLEAKAIYREEQHAIEKGNLNPKSATPYAKEILESLKAKVEAIDKKKREEIEPLIYKSPPLTESEFEAELRSTCRKFTQGEVEELLEVYKDDPVPYRIVYQELERKKIEGLKNEPPIDMNELNKKYLTHTNQKEK